MRPFLHFATFLSPNLYKTHEYIANSIGEQLGYTTLFTLGDRHSLDSFAEGQIHLGFMCGLLYIHVAKQCACPLELVAAPVLVGKRYQGKPIYFSDVIVRRDSPYTSFDDLGGCVWAYNESASHSGWNIVCYSLLMQGKTPHYFGKTIETGSHQRSLQMVLEGRADGAAIDSHMLDVSFLQDSTLAAKIRVIATLGPSTIPPVVASKNLNPVLRDGIRSILVDMHHDPRAAAELRKGAIARFVPIADEHYQDIRQMTAATFGYV
jgi:phosphonate transport system substrate-binding protein